MDGIEVNRGYIQKVLPHDGRKIFGYRDEPGEWHWQSGASLTQDEHVFAKEAGFDVDAAVAEKALNKELADSEADLRKQHAERTKKLKAKAVEQKFKRELSSEKVLFENPGEVIRFSKNDGPRETEKLSSENIGGSSWKVVVKDTGDVLQESVITSDLEKILKGEPVLLK